MPPAQAAAGEARALIRIGLPLVGSHLAQVAIQTTDTVMLGWYHVEALAAASLAGPVFFVIFLLGSGFALAVMPMVASAAGTGDDRHVRRVTRMGLWLSILYGLVVTPLLFFGTELFTAMGQTPELSSDAGLYISILGLGMTPALMVMVMKSYFSALELTRAILVVTLASAGLNAILDYAMIFGNWGLPEMGLRGAGYASVIGQLFGVVLLAGYATIRTPQYELFKNFQRPDWEAFGQVFRLGWPIGGQLLAEVGLFAFSSVMMGWVGVVPLAAHGIALQIASITFMVHLGLSQAATVRGGRAWGQRDRATLRAAAVSGVMLSLAAAVAIILLFLGAPDLLIGLFVDPADPARPEILTLGAIFLAVAALFQFFDSAQVMGAGLLRGVHDTHVPMILAGVAYWAIGLPVAYWLGFPAGMGGVGIWLGLTVGLAVAAATMQYRFWTRYVWTPARAAVTPPPF